MAYSAPKGTRDILPPEIAVWQAVEALYRDVAESFGFSEVRTPCFERTDVFQRGVGDATDIVQKEMYTFLDKAGRSMTLRPEGTAGVVRCFIQNGLASTAYPVKLYYAMNLFRYENVQEGRYREFHQLGLECFGAEGPEADAEIIALLHVFFQRLGLRETHLTVNSIGCPVCRAAYEEALRVYYQAHVNELCPDCKRRLERNPLRLLDCKEAACHALAMDAPILADYLDDDCRAHFGRLQENLDELGISYEINPRLVRGLDYYTRTVFEYVSDHVGTQGTICGGGRYDRLVGELGGAETAACGFAMGQERLLKEMAAQGIHLPVPGKKALFITAQGEAAARRARQLAQTLRMRGIHAETELCQRSFKAQMKYAGRNGFHTVLILGERELETGLASLRNMKTGEQREIDVNQINKLITAVTEEGWQNANG